MSNSLPGCTQKLFNDNISVFNIGYCFDVVESVFAKYQTEARALKMYMINLKANTPPPLSSTASRPDKDETKMRQLEPLSLDIAAQLLCTKIARIQEVTEKHKHIAILIFCNLLLLKPFTNLK